MKIKNYLLAILFPIFIIFAFLPVSAAENTEETETDSTAKVETSIKDEEDAEVKETLQENKKDATTAEKEDLPQVSTEINSVARETKSETVKTEKSAEPKYEKTESNEAKSEEETSEPEKKDSNYVVEFTHNKLTYILPGDSSVKLSKILDKLEIKGSDITEVECSDTSLFSATKESGEWVINSHKAFHTDEHLYVTIDNTKYNIKVTDYTLPNNRWSWYNSDKTIAITSSRVSKSNPDVYGYYYYETRTLKLLGASESALLDSSQLKDYSEKESPMWNMCGDINTSTGNYVLHVEMDDKITYIGNNFFFAVNRDSSTSSTKKAFTIHLPSSLTSIGNYAFQESGISKLYMPDNVSSIGTQAFQNCPQLTYILIPNTVSTINTGAFNNTPNNCHIYVGATCTNLNSACGNNVSTRFGNYSNQYFHWYGQKIGSTVYAFPKTASEPKGHAGNYNTSPNNSSRTQLEIVGYGAMTNYSYSGSLSPIKSNTPQVTTVTFNNVFGDKLVNSYDRYISSIGNYAFFQCSNITSITVPSSGLTEIGKGAFEQCTSLSSIKPSGATSNTLPATISNNTLSESIFNACSSLTSFTIPSNITTIGTSAFKTSGLTSITITSAVKTIGTSAFQNCSSITSLTIPTTINSSGIGENAFSGLANRADIYYNGTESAFEGKCVYPVVNTFGYEIEDTAANSYVYHFPCGGSLWYGVDGYNNKITITGSGAMTNYSAGGSPITAHYTSGKPFTTVDIQAGTSIGNYAFLNCVTLTTISIPNSVTTIGISAFQGCSGITSLTIPTTISSSGLKANAFSGLANRADIYYNGSESDFTSKCTTSVANVFGYDIESTAANSYIYHFMCGTSLWYSVDGANAKITITGSGAMTNYSAGGSPFTTHYASGKPFTTVDIQAGTTIGNYAFYNCVTLASVSIPNTVTTIGIGAFQASTTLTTITIPSSVTTINNSAFQSCSGITSLTIPTTISSSGLKANAFDRLANRAYIYYNGTEDNFTAKCTTSVANVFGYDIESAAANSYVYHFPCGNSLWYGVDGANAKITITGSGAMTNYSAGVVSPITAHYTSGKTFTTIDMQEGTSIGTYAFLDCATLETVTVPSSGLTVVGNNAFDSCTSLTSIKPANATTSDPNTLPATISNNILPEALFFNCSSLTSFTIPSNITTIDDYAFMQAGLTSVTIPSNVTTINSQAFYGDTSLTTVTIPNTVTTIQAGAFQGCSSLATVYFDGNDTTTPYSNNITSIGQNAFAGLTTNADIWYRYGDKASLIAKCYDATTLDSSFGTGNKYIYHFSENAGGQCGPALYWEIWSIYQYVDGTNDVNTKEMDITGSGDFYTSYNSTNRPWTNNVDREDTITKVVITKTDASGADITNIGDAVFRAFNALTTVEMPNTITDIRHDAFWKCTALANITLPSNLQIIGAGAFNSCALTSISIPASVTQISNPSNNSKPEWGGFANCTSLASVTFEGTPSIQTIGIGAFYNCTSLTSINIPASVITIGNSAFRGDSALTTVTLPPKASTTLTTIGEQAFRQCTALTTIRPSDETSVNTFPAGVTTIGAVAFYEDSALTGITIPTNVTLIGNQAFENCTGLTYINFTSGRNSDLDIGSRAFRSLDNASQAIGTLTIPANVIIGADAFSHRQGCFTTIDLSAMNKSIGTTAFWGDSGIQNVYLGSNITSIGGRVFTVATTFWYKYGTKAELIDKMGYNDGQTTSNPPPPSGTTLTQQNYSFPNNNHVFHFLKSGGESTDKCGENLYWRVEYDYDDNDDNEINDTTMYVTGSGNFYTTYTNNNRPWINNKNASGTTSTGEDNEITKVVIDSGATDVGAHVFQSLHALQSVTIPNTVLTINGYAFYLCENLNGVTLPNNLTKIEYCAFRGCTGLTSINIPKSLTSITGTENNNISMGAFSSCTSLANITFESGRTQNLVLGAGAFYNTRAASITLPEKLTVIGPGAFQANTNLTTISLPSTLTTIDQQAFYLDAALTSITIPTTVTTMNTNAFSGLANEADIYYNGTEADFISKCTTSVVNVFGSANPIERSTANSYYYHFKCGDNLYYSLDSISETTEITGTGPMWNYNTSDNISPFKTHDSIIKNVDMSTATGTSASKLTVGAYAFYQCATLEGITLPENTHYQLAGSAFEESGIKSITLPSSLSWYSGYNIFKNCTRLETATININRIYSSSFAGCTALTNLTLSDSVTRMESTTFDGCSKLASVTIPTSITTFGGNNFRNIGSDSSISQVDIYYAGKQAALESKCSGSNIATSFGFAVVNDGKYAFHFTQDITYYEADGSPITGSPTSYQTASGNTINLYEPQGASKQFAGWCTDQALSTEPIKSFTAAKNAPYGDLVYYAKWITERTIFYIVNGGTALANGSFRPLSGDTVVLATTTKSGNAFLGWHFEEDLSDASIGSFVADENHNDDVTVYAEWYERENISYWANSSQTLQSTTEYEIIKPWETTLQGGTAQSPKWYVLNSDVTFDKRLIVNGHVNLILQDGCNLVVNKGISVNNPNSITIYAQDSDYNYINQDLGNITRMNLKKIEYEYDYNRTTYGTDDYDDGPIVDLTTGKTYMRTALGQYVYNDESGTELIVDDNSWKEEGEEGSGVWYCIPEGETEKYYEGEEGGRSYIATAEGTQKYYLNNDYATKWSNALWTKNNDWNNLGDNQSYFFDTVSLKSYYYEDTDGDYYYETTDSERTHKYYNLGGGYFTDDWDAYSNHKKAGKIESNPSSEGAGIGGDQGNINGDITIYGGEYKLYGGLGNAGIGTGAFESGSNANNHTITINGGTFDIDARIDGGTAIGGGSHANGGSIVINGGRLTLDCQEDGVACIGAGNGVTTNTTQISLSWTNITDYITIKKNNINYSTLTIDSNKPFVFVGEDIITDDSYATAETITGKENSEFTIIPYPNTSYVLTMPKTTTLPFKTTKYKFKSDSSDDEKPSVSVYTRPDDETTPEDESTPLVKPYQIVLNIAKTNFVKDGDATKTIVYDLVDKTDTSLVGEDEYFSSDSYDYDNYRETHIGGAQDVWMSIDSSVWENLSPGIYRATVTFNVGLATNGTSSGGGGPTYIDPGSGSFS